MKLILASQSPRRVFLLEQMGLEFEQISSDFDEYFDESRSSEDIAKELGLGKALAVANQHPDAIVIGSDLVIDCEGKQIGKAENNQDAVDMLMSFSGKTQRLITSVAVVCKDKQYQRVSCDIATVTFPILNKEFIESYVQNNYVLDRAGAYDIRHADMQQLGLTITGRLDTIIGLPTNLVAQYLLELGIPAKELSVSEKEFYTNTEF